MSRLTTGLVCFIHKRNDVTTLLGDYTRRARVLQGCGARGRVRMIRMAYRRLLYVNRFAWVWSLLGNVIKCSLYSFNALEHRHCSQAPLCILKYFCISVNLRSTLCIPRTWRKRGAMFLNAADVAFGKRKCVANKVAMCYILQEHLLQAPEGLHLFRRHQRDWISKNAV